MRSVLSFRFALLGSLGLLHACGGRSTESTSSNAINEGKDDRDGGKTSAPSKPRTTPKPTPSSTHAAPPSATTAAEPPVPAASPSPNLNPAPSMPPEPDTPAPVQPAPVPPPAPMPTDLIPQTPEPPTTAAPMPTFYESVCPEPETESPIAAGLLECGNGLVHRPEVTECGPVIDIEPDLHINQPDLSEFSEADGGWYYADAGPELQHDFSACEVNADCTDGTNGRCTVVTDSAQTWTYCAYPCSADSDCGADAICECMGEARTCVPAHCHTDADCAPGHACARFVYDGCGPIAEYACTTDADTCRISKDCEGDASDAPTAGCLPRSSETDDGAHCQSSTCSEGRPFLVAGAARTASVIERADWTSPIAADLTCLDKEQRRLLSDHWARIGQMEHASIAAFARFALQLLSVGAPPELLSATSAAMVDETLHARLAFGLASVYRGHALGPAALDCTDALGACDLESSVMGTLLEGCIGETMAALDAQSAFERCQDPAVAGVLEIIVRDETRHAELAWKFVQWAVEREPGLLTKAIALAKSECEAARMQQRNQSTPTPEASWQSRYGVTSYAEQTELRAQVVEQIVLPCLTALAASSERVAPPAQLTIVNPRFLAPAWEV